MERNFIHMLNLSINYKKKIKKFIFVGIFIFFLTNLIFFSLYSSINLPTQHLDGAFQTASALFRIENGEIIGKDFLPYLGLGPFLILFPFFKIAGGNLFASVFAVKFITLFIKWIIISFIFHLIFRSPSYKISLIGGVFFYFLFNQLSPSIPYLDLINFSFLKINRFFNDPGNSLRPIRAAIPYLISIGTYALILPGKNWKLQHLLAGFFIGLSMQWSNDYALITSIIFFVFYIGYFNFKYKVFWLKSVITLILYSFISWLFILSFITAGHPLEIIKYNFFDVAKDQWWYFAPYEEINKVFGIQEVYKIFLKEIWFPLATLIFTLLKAIQKRRVEYYLLFMLGLISLCGGIIASLGGHVSLYYFQSFIFWAATTSILALLRVTQIFIMNLLIKKEIIFSISKNTFYLFVFLFKCLWR